MNYRRLIRALVPSIAQAIGVGAILVTGVIAYNVGARHSSHADHQSAGANATAEPTSIHPLDTNQDGIIYVSPMHPQFQQDEPGNCPICGMEMVARQVGKPAAATAVPSTSHTHADEPIGYACAMNCVPPLEEPGKCPVCGMEMQPVQMGAASSSLEDSRRRLTMSAEAMALADVQTTEVRRGPATRVIHLVGQLVEDPGGRYHLSANVGGRIDVLHARFDRDHVQAGKPIAEIYSPELLAVQEELLQALASAQRWEAEGNAVLERSARESVTAIRRRLLLAGLTLPQIDTIQQGGKALERLELISPVGGIVTSRFVEQGQYVERGERIVTLSDYRALWAELEVFASDLSAIENGSSVSITTPAQPGRRYAGVVEWIDPLTSGETRTTRVRVVLDNPELALKPGMYVRATASATSREDAQPLLIPHSAPLITGKRAVVYTLDHAGEGPAFVGREVELGDRVDEGYVVLSGLEEGERVVTRGAFQIDSSLQILARPSMMNPEGGIAVEGHAGHGIPTGESAHQMAPAGSSSEALSAEGARQLLPAYLKIQSALAADDFETARAEWPILLATIVTAGDHELHQAAIGNATASIANMRLAFLAVSIKVIPHIDSLDQPVVHVHCPMAFDGKGSNWLQLSQEIANPYFGAAMLRCGTIKGEVTP